MIVLVFSLPISSSNVTEIAILNKHTLKYESNFQFRIIAFDPMIDECISFFQWDDIGNMLVNGEWKEATKYKSKDTISMKLNKIDLKSLNIQLFKNDVFLENLVWNVTSGRDIQFYFNVSSPNQTDKITIL